MGTQSRVEGDYIDCDSRHVGLQWLASRLSRAVAVLVNLLVVLSSIELVDADLARSSSVARHHRSLAALATGDVPQIVSSNTHLGQFPVSPSTISYPHLL
jgi:hypothetical protein